MNTCVKLTLVLSLVMPLASGCTNAQAPSTKPQASQTQTQNVPEFSQAQLDSLLAPIALYPDTVLSHVLIASTYPLEVVQADRWARSNKKLMGDEAVQAVEDQDWDPSVKALVAFPDVLRRMSDDLEWTQQLGDAFLADESRVMDSVQNLRDKAYASGNLDKVEHVKVVREERVITIEPAVERVVYVPVYDTRVVYGNWWWADYPPVYWNHPASYTYVSGFYWGPRVYIGSHFFFSGCHWRDRRVVIMDRHHHNHHSHHFYNNRSIVHYRDSRHWHHNPTHRRGVAYYDNRTRERFHSPRESYRDSRTYRSNLRSPDSHIRPNQARDRRQDNRQDHRQGDRHLESNRTGNRQDDNANGRQSPRETRIVGGGRVENGRTQPQTVDRAQHLRERLGNNNPQENRPSPSNPRTDERWSQRVGEQAREQHRTDRQDRNNRQDRTVRQIERTTESPHQAPYRGTDQRVPRAEQRTENPTLGRPNINQRIEQPREREPTRERTEPTRIEQPREQPERQVRPSPERSERVERPQRDDSRSFRNNDRQDSGRSRGESRESLRGGRER